MPETSFVTGDSITTTSDRTAHSAISRQQCLKQWQPDTMFYLSKTGNQLGGRSRPTSATASTSITDWEMKIGETNYWRKQMASGWTEGRRERQSEAIRRWQPWEKSTGPRTAKGKAKASQNAFRGGVRLLLRSLGKLLRRQQKSLDDYLRR